MENDLVLQDTVSRRWEMTSSYRTRFRGSRKLPRPTGHGFAEVGNYLVLQDTVSRRWEITSSYRTRCRGPKKFQASSRPLGNSSGPLPRRYPGLMLGLSSSNYSGFFWACLGLLGKAPGLLHGRATKPQAYWFLSAGERQPGGGRHLVN